MNKTVKTIARDIVIAGSYLLVIYLLFQLVNPLPCQNDKGSFRAAP